MLRKILLLVGVLLVVLVGSGVWLVRYRPLALLRWYEQRALADAGFQKSVLAGPAGKLAVWEAGQGPVIVLLHGAGDRAAAWSQVAPKLAGLYRVVIPDLPGHGESEPAEGPLQLSAVLKGVEAVVAQRGGSPPVILTGISMGGWLALLYAREHPDRVARIVSLNGGGIANPGQPSLTPADREEARKLMALLRDPSSQPLPDYVLDDIVRTSRQGPIGRLLQETPDMVALLLDGRLHEIRTPVDLLWGESDRFLSVDFARRMGSQLPAARLTLVPRCGHVTVRECPLALVQALEKLLQGPPSEFKPAPAAKPSSKHSSTAPKS